MFFRKKRAEVTGGRDFGPEAAPENLENLGAEVEEEARAPSGSSLFGHLRGTKMEVDDHGGMIRRGSPPPWMLAEQFTEKD